MEISFVPVNEKNIETVQKLHIAASQKGMVETVTQCYAEAQQRPLWHPTVICADERMIGFTMYGLWGDEGDAGRVWLDRFFVDESCQGRGYAKLVLPLLLDRIIGEYGCDEIYLSVFENNSVAIHLYQEHGFLFNQEIDINGEKVMVLPVARRTEVSA